MHKLLSPATRWENSSSVDLMVLVILTFQTSNFLLCSRLCSYRAGTREVHNKLEKDRWVQLQRREISCYLLSHMKDGCIMCVCVVFRFNLPSFNSWKLSCVVLNEVMSQTPPLCLVSARRKHLKECFETLKKNIPNIEEKKTSNLSVLRSALRYIQVSCWFLISDQNLHVGALPLVD